MTTAHQLLTPDTQAAAEAFAGRMTSLIDASAVTSMIAVGHRLKLFDTLAGLPAGTSEDVARAAGLSERYVREWLAVMVTGRIVQYDPRTRTYLLPPEHAACLTTGAPLGNLAVYTQHAALLGQIQERLLQCFSTGEGTAYDEYPNFHEIMAEDSEQTVVSHLFDTILPLADALVDRLESGVDLMDAGCGRGAALLAMAERFPHSRFVGLDLSEEATAAAQGEATRRGLRNVLFEARDLRNYDEPARFDVVTSFDAIHDQADPEGLIRALKGTLRAGGIYLVQDIGGSAQLEQNLDFPMASMLYAVSCAHCLPVSLGQGGPGLGTMWGWETAQDMLTRAGFSSVTRHVLPHDPMNVWFVART